MVSQASTPRACPSLLRDVIAVSMARRAAEMVLQPETPKNGLGSYPKTFIKNEWLINF